MKINLVIKAYNSKGTQVGSTLTKSLIVKPLPEIEVYINNSALFYDKTEIQPGDYKQIYWSAKNFDSIVEVSVSYANNAYMPYLFIVDESGLNSFIQNEGKSVDPEANGFTGMFEEGKSYYLVCLTTFFDHNNLMSNDLYENASMIKIVATVSKYGVINPTSAEVSVQVVPLEIKDVTLAGSTSNGDSNNFEVLNGTSNGLQMLINTSEDSSDSTNIYRQIYGFKEETEKGKGSYVIFNNNYVDLNAEIENRSLSNYISHLIIDDDNRKKDNPII